VLALLVLAPLLFFASQMSRARWRGMLEYGELAEHYVDRFRARWLAGSARDEGLLGTADIQSLADLGGGYETAQGMRVAPIDRATLLGLVVLVALPFVPLLFTMISGEELVRHLVQAIL
jgi:hypothetical protein